MLGLGFETIGNATIILYDRRPLLVTDPWIQGTAYFGSWQLSHEVPQEQREAILESRYVWFSHGHPDHLNADSLEVLRGKKILLPDHVGGRIEREMIAQGFDVSVLEDRKWTRLSDHVRILSISDIFQNGILLVDIAGRLIINLNDSIDRGWGHCVRAIARGYSTSFLLALSGYGDADMINLYDESGDFIRPPCAMKFPVGPLVAKRTERWGAKYFVPFSSMHQYHRKDSAHANQYITPVGDHSVGFVSSRCEILPPFLRYDCQTGVHEVLSPAKRPIDVVDPSEFGDDWSETLDQDDYEALRQYFLGFEHLRTFLDFVNFRVGGKDHPIEFCSRRFKRGLTFEVPRSSLMQAVRFRVFDDLLIGNFMKTTLHGKWPQSQLYPDFTPYVTKYGDNGGAFSLDELNEYFLAYQKRAPLEFIHFRLEQAAINTVRRFVRRDSKCYRMLNRGYWKVRSYI